MNKLVITTINDIIYYGYFQDGKAVELYCEKKDSPSLLGNIYVARVEKIADGINGAFVELSKEQKAFYKLTPDMNPVKVSPGHEDKLYGGDLILVQVTKDAVKTKLPVVDGNVCLIGKYFVLSFEKRGINISKKIKDSRKRDALLTLVSEFIEEHAWNIPTFQKKKKDLPCGIVIRTNAANVDSESLMAELKQLIHQYEQMIRKAFISPGRTLIGGEVPYYIRLARELPSYELDEILTDDLTIFDQLKNYYGDTASSDIANKITYYKDDYSLYKLYRFDHYYDMALHKIVPLKSGGSIVIEQTEAMVVIDVNSGAVIKSKKHADSVSETLNKEAAVEIVNQLRLRNLSGMIIIDFINMKKEESRNTVFGFLKKECERDRISTRVIDFTALNLVEMTRSKVRRSLSEQWKECHHD